MNATIDLQPKIYVFFSFSVKQLEQKSVFFSNWINLLAQSKETAPSSLNPKFFDTPDCVLKHKIACVWVPSRFSCFLPQSGNLHILNCVCLQPFQGCLQLTPGDPEFRKKWVQTMNEWMDGRIYILKAYE